MQKIDRLGWAGGLSFTAYGARIGIRTTDLGALPHLRECLPPGARPSSSPIVKQLYSLVVGGEQRPGVRRFSIAYANAARLARTADLAEAIEAIAADLRLHVAAKARRRVFVHAGVVTWNGRAIVMPGRTSIGKSRLVEALVEAGATPYSDRYAVVDDRGRVHPYERVDRGRPLPLGMLVDVPYRAGARWRTRRVSRGKGALALLASAVAVTDAPEAVTALARAVMPAAVVRGVRGEAKEAAGRILALARESW